MTAHIPAKRQVGAGPGPQRAALQAMLQARSVALVGASARPGTFGQRMTEEVTRSPARPEVYLVNPGYAQIGERRCYPSLADLPGPVDLVLLGVPDAALEQQLTLAARRGDAAAVIFGNAHEDQPGSDSPGPSPPRPALRDRLTAIASSAGMELCGAGCMGFVNISYGLRAIGYTEPDPLPAGPVALVTHSGSVFSALLRTRRAIGFTLAVSSGQELVTAAPAYLDYALALPGTRVLALVLEAMRQGDQLRQVLATAAERDIPVVLLTAGSSASGRMMVAAHSGALAAADGGWEALARAYGVHRVSDLAEMADTLEMFAIGRRARRAGSGSHANHGRGGIGTAGIGTAGIGTAGIGTAGIATVHDSGLERAHAADLAEELGVPFATISQATTAALAGILDPGLVPANPLDVWGTGADTRELFADSLSALADDPSVAAVALAVDLVHELDGDQSYPQAALDAAARTDKPVAVLSNLSSVIDPDLAAQLRQAGIPVLEGLRSGMLALRHLLDHARQAPGRAAPDLPAEPATAGHGRPVWPGPGASRRDRAACLLGAATSGAGTSGAGTSGAGTSGAGASGASLLALLREYGIATARAEPASDARSVRAAAESIGYPVVLKTDEPAIQHKSDAHGVLLGLRDQAELAAAYRDLAARLGPRALVCETVAGSTELALGIARDPDLGPLIVVGAGGVLVELLADRAVALPPVDEDVASQMLSELRIGKLLNGVRGAPAVSLAAIIRAITSLSALAEELGDELEGLDINPLICSPGGAIAVDALAVPRARRSGT